MTPIANLRALIALAGQATGGLWIVREPPSKRTDYRILGHNGDPTLPVARTFGDSFGAQQDAAFIAAARTAIPDMEAMIAENERLTKNIATMTLHSPSEHYRLKAEAAVTALRGQVEAERDACAKVADDVASDANENAVYAQGTEAWTVGAADDLFRDAATATKIATRIRARAALATNRGT